MTVENSQARCNDVSAFVRPLLWGQAGVLGSYQLPLWMTGHRFLDQHEQEHTRQIQHPHLSTTSFCRKILHLECVISRFDVLVECLGVDSIILCKFVTFTTPLDIFDVVSHSFVPILNGLLQQITVLFSIFAVGGACCSSPCNMLTGALWADPSWRACCVFLFFDGRLRPRPSGGGGGFGLTAKYCVSPPAPAYAFADLAPNVSVDWAWGSILGPYVMCDHGGIVW